MTGATTYPGGAYCGGGGFIESKALRSAGGFFELHRESDRSIGVMVAGPARLSLVPGIGFVAVEKPRENI
jgi:hypothetical protein